MLKKVKDWIGPSLDVYKVENANDVGVGLCRHIWQGEKDATQIGTTLNAEIMNNLQNSLVHTITATKNAGSGVDYYVCNLDGLNEFGLNKDLKLRINVDYENTNTTTKLRLNNNDYTLLKEQNGTLKQIEAGDIHRNKTYELIYNGSQFVIINLFKNFESAYLDNYVKTTDLAQENKAGIVTLNKIKGLIPAATNDTNGTINLRQINDMIDTKVPNASNNTNGTVNLRQINDMIDIRVPSATNNIAGKVMLGTTRNTALEGSRLGEILGLEFGGNIQDSGSKIKGKFYYDSVTKFYYECLENTNLTYNDSGKFRAISNKPLSDKVENLFENTNNLTFKTGTVKFNAGNTAVGTFSSIFRHNFEKSFKKKCLGVFVQNVGSNEEVENLTNIINTNNSGFEFNLYRLTGSNILSTEIGIFNYFAIGC